MSSFQGKFIKDTFDGILHSDVELTSSIVPIYDGKGNQSSLSLATDGNGATITGGVEVSGGATISGELVTDDLKVGTLEYPSTNGTAGEFLYQVDANTIGRTSSVVPILSPSPAGNYDISDLQSIVVNNKGLVTGVTSVEELDADLTRITSTIYRDKPVSLTTNVVEIPASDSSAGSYFVNVTGKVSAQATAVICFVQCDNLGVGSAKHYTLLTSHDSNLDDTLWNPIYASFDSSSSDINGGGQFVTLLTKTGTRGFYMHYNYSNLTSATQTVPVKIWVIGYQE